MDFSSSEDLFKQKTFTDQSALNAKLLCPLCKEATPSIEGIETSLMRNPFVKFNCTCLSLKGEESIDLSQYLRFLLQEDHTTCVCFKHPEAIASIYCQNCSLNMCTLCYSYHLSFEPTHSVVSIESESPSCSFHLNTDLDFMCVDCNENICIHCAKKAHAEHQVMQLKEYWERVNSRLAYQTNDTLNAFLVNQSDKYSFFIQKQLEKINAIIFNLQQIKAKLEQRSQRVQNENQSVGMLIRLVFAEFFKGKSSPNYKLIQNVERIVLEDIEGNDAYESVFRKYARIDEEIKQLSNKAKDLAPRVISMSKMNLIDGNRHCLNEKGNAVSDWLNEEDALKKNCAISSNCSTNSTNEDKLSKMIKKEEILRTLNIFPKKKEDLFEKIGETKTKAFLNNKTERTKETNGKNIIRIKKSTLLQNSNEKDISLYLSFNPIDNERKDTRRFQLKSNRGEKEGGYPQYSKLLIREETKESQNKEKVNKKVKRKYPIGEEVIELNQIIEIDEQGNSYQYNAHQALPIQSKAIQYDQCISTLNHNSQVNALTQLKTGHLISGGTQASLRQYDSNSLDCLSTLDTNNNQIYCITELFDGSIAVGLNDNSIKVYDSSSRTCMMILIGHSKPVTAIVQKDITTILSCSEDNTVKSWDLTTKKCLMTYDEHCKGVCAVVRVNESSMISASKDSTLKLWGYSNNKSIHTIKAHSSPISALIKLFSDQLATASADKTIKFWDEQIKSCRGVLVGHLDTVSSIVQLIDGNLASSSYDSSMKIWNLQSMTCINTIKVSSLKVFFLIQLSDGSIASVAEDFLIKIWV